MRTHYFKKTDPSREFFDEVVECYNQDRLDYGAVASPIPNDRYFDDCYNDREELEYQVRFTACGKVSDIEISSMIHDCPSMEYYYREVDVSTHDDDLGIDHKSPPY